MLTIKQVTMKNFLSVGNAPQTVKLDVEGLTLILGENLDVGGVNSRNGVGKSTLLQAISYGLFGQSLSNIKKDNLVNSTNSKNMSVTVEFECQGKEYRVERGRKPQYFKYFVNDGLVTDPDTDESQGEGKNTDLEIQKVLGFSHDMFRHIIAMNTYTEPFLKLRPGDQRLIIEELLGITQISQRSDILKELLKSTKDSIKEEEYRVKAAQESNAKVQSAINDLMNKSNAWESARNARITSAETALEDLENLNIDQEISNHHKLADYTGLVVAINQTQKDITRHENDLVRMNNNYERLVANLAKAEEHKCHACGQDIHDAKHDTLIETLKKQIDEFEPELHQAVADVESQYAVLSELAEALGAIGDEPQVTYSSLAQALEHRNTINNLFEAINREEGAINPYQDQINTLTNTGLQVIEEETLIELNSLFKHQDFLLKLLVNKDSFIRKKIIDQNINHLNHRLNFYLEKLGLPHEVKFKSDLSVEIDLLGRDFDFEQLSRGEMNRVILSTSWAFRDVWESLNQGVNLLMVDEMIDNGMDQQGSEAALDIMKRMARERGKNIFLVSHKDELVGRVNKILLVKKENSFTKFNDQAESVE
jgi:DNA repair exonuclease SbcCD ATPase subunit